ncbi:MAG: zinc finger Ran-binding domain-containing protein [Pyrinomonadaceae bacterium]
MPSAAKCPNCGLVNFATAEQCKRCGVALAGNGVPAQGYQAQSQLVVAEDGYVFPPPPNFGEVWHDRSILVFTRDAMLPDRCVKCNSFVDGSRLRKKLSWHHPAIYLLILAGLLVYAIVAMVLSKRATVELGICEDHRRKRRYGMMIGWMLFLGGIMGAILGIAYDYIGIMTIGFLLIPVGLVWLILAARFVNVKKIDDRFVWLKGINREYLATLPAWPW